MAKRILLIVDVQNDFLHPLGALSVSKNRLDGAGLAAGIDHFVAQAAANKTYDILIATRDWHPTKHCSFERNGGTWPVHCVHHTWGAGLMLSSHTLCLLEKNIISKGQNNNQEAYSPFKDGPQFQHTQIMNLLKAFGIYDPSKAIIDVIGVATEYCVKATALDAVKAGFSRVRVLKQFVLPVNLKPDDEEKAIIEMKDVGIEIVE